MSKEDRPIRNRRGHGRGRTQDGKPNPIDVHVGMRVRLRRTLMGMSQEKLGELIGLTFQQVQKYERGANRVGASRLYDLSRVLEVPVGFFFDDMPDEITSLSPASGVTDTPDYKPDEDEMHKRETLELVRAYYRISDPKLRRNLFDLMKSLGDGSDAD